jgi:phenol 2-monooxygenase
LFPPEQLDTTDPYLLLAHQGFLENVLLKDMVERDFVVERHLTFVDYKTAPGNWPIEVLCKTESHTAKTILSRYLVGCDGAQSGVRKAMGVRQVGTSTDGVWGVIDGVLDTNFPDLYSKVVINSKEAGSILLFPRERNMTRLYIELKPELRDGASNEELSQEYVMERAAEIFEVSSNIPHNSVDRINVEPAIHVTMEVNR